MLHQLMTERGSCARLRVGDKLGTSPPHRLCLLICRQESDSIRHPQRPSYQGIHCAHSLWSTGQNGLQHLSCGRSC